MGPIYTMKSKLSTGVPAVVMATVTSGTPMWRQKERERERNRPITANKQFTISWLIKDKNDKQAENEKGATNTALLPPQHLHT